MVGAGALSRKKLRYVPENIAPQQTITETQSIVENFRTSRKAIAPGAINNPIARTKPTAERVATIVSDKAASIP